MMKQEWSKRDGSRHLARENGTARAVAECGQMNQGLFHTYSREPGFLTRIARVAWLGIPRNYLCSYRYTVVEPDSASDDYALWDTRDR